MLKEFRTLIPLARKYRMHYILGVLCLVVTNIGELYIPQLIRQSVDTISLGIFELRDIGILVLAIVGIAAVVASARFGWRYFIQGASRNIEYDMREMIFDQLLVLSPSFYAKMKTGDIMARFTNDMHAVRMASGIALVALLDGIFLTLAILIILFTSYPLLALYTVIPLPLITLIILLAGKVIGRRFKRVQEGFSRLSERVRETVSGIRVVKSFVKESYVEKLFKEQNAHYKKLNMDLIKVWGLFFPLVTFISGLTILLLFIFGGSQVIEGTLTPGSFVAFMSYLTMLRWPVLGMGFTINILQRGAASLSRINVILDERPDITSPEKPLPRAPSGSIRAEGVTFAYSEDAEPVLTDISFTVDAGTTLGILGRTGSGKSTLIKLIPRLLDPPPRTICIGDRDIRDYDLLRLRKSIAMIPQDTFLFSDSIKENIAFGKPDASDEEIRLAADLSTISRELYQFPHGWDTIVGERGVTLSGGQKQRIAISRALLLDVEYLIMDDAMSAVDSETEEAILQAVIQKRTGKTNIFVSHRVSALQHAHRILVLDKGRIIQYGSHQELVTCDGFYREIYLLQQAERRRA